MPTKNGVRIASDGIALLVYCQPYQGSSTGIRLRTASSVDPVQVGPCHARPADKGNCARMGSQA
jgi:hypothetical protein